MTALACIGEPISWLRLERFAAGTSDATIREHVDTCPACRACLDEIERDVVALPPLVVPHRRTWWKLAVPAFTALAAAAIVLLLLRPREPEHEGVAHIKGLGTVELDVVRERGGVTRDDVRSYLPGDRFKVIVTCPPDRPVWLEISVLDLDTKQIDHPLPPAQIVCGNRVILPGAFSLTGRANRVCVRISTDASSQPAGNPCLMLRGE